MLDTIMNKFNERSLNWEGCHNVRDLGGLPMESGAQTRRGKVIRSDDPGQLSPAGWQAVAQAGVRLIIDLRAPHEVQKEPYIIPDEFEIAWRNRPLEKFLPEVGALISQAKTRAEVYTIILDHYPDMVAEVLRTIAAVADGAVLIHCQAGKDRTGTIAALLLDLAGVPAAWIAADYAESQNRLRHLYQQALAEAGSEENLPFWSRPTATAEMMLAVLEHLRHRYGSTEQYLLSAGVSADDIERLRKKLMGDHPAS